MTQWLVRTPTPNPPGDVRACAQVIGDLLAKDSISVEQVAVTDTLVNIIAILGGRRPGKTLWYFYYVIASGVVTFLVIAGLKETAHAPLA